MYHAAADYKLPFVCTVAKKLALCDLIGSVRPLDTAVKRTKAAQEYTKLPT